jgi:predicted AAA+ superfamily ATPase
MLNYTPTPGTSSYGDLFEQFIVNQIYALSQYRRLDYKLSYLQTKAGFEIDLVIWRPGKSLLFIEIKSAHYVDDRDCKNLRSLYPDFKECDFVLLSRDPIRKQIGMVEAWFFSDFLRVFGS